MLDTVGRQHLAYGFHAGGNTDSFGPLLRPLTDGLGLLPYSCGVHYDSDAQRRHIRGMLEGTNKTFEQVFRERAAASTAKRYGDPAELGAFCAFLCSIHAGYITGQNLLIDGGSYPGAF